MNKFLCAALLFCVTACYPARPAQKAMELQPSTQSDIPVASTDQPGWHLDLPKGWQIEPSEDADTFLARSDSFIGGAPAAVLVRRFDVKDDPSEFGAFVALATVASGKYDVITAQPVDVHGTSGSIVIFRTRQGSIVLQIAASKSKDGYVIRCGGDLRATEQIIHTCEPIVLGFQLK